jgi:hypothetical protein
VVVAVFACSCRSEGVGVDAEEASYDLLRGGRACDSAGKHMLWGWAGKHLIGKVRTRMGRGTSDAWGRHHRRDQGKATLHDRRGQVDACAGLVPRPSVLAFFKPSRAGAQGRAPRLVPTEAGRWPLLGPRGGVGCLSGDCALAASRRWLGSWPQHKAPRG